jgi:hypothetical protein
MERPQQMAHFFAEERSDACAGLTAKKTPVEIEA